MDMEHNMIYGDDLGRQFEEGGCQYPPKSAVIVVRVTRRGSADKGKNHTASWHHFLTSKSEEFGEISLELTQVGFTYSRR